MASTTVEVKIIDHEQVSNRLDAAAKLAEAVEDALCDENIDYTRAARSLRAALKDFKKVTLTNTVDEDDYCDECGR